MTGTLIRVMDEECRLKIGAFEYQVLIPEYLRRMVQTRVGEELTLAISEYLEGSQMSNRMVPRKIGFANEQELGFFDLFCTVDKIGPKKALKALGRPISEVAHAIQRGDSKWLTTLPGIGKTSADQIIATLRSKVQEYTMLSSTAPGESSDTGRTSVNPSLIDDVYEALLGLGLGPGEARDKLDKVLKLTPQPDTVQEYINLIFAR